jgi:sugar O-acyltransferase (sialic acid O-acetyltransferase NeuD family)
MRILIMGAGAHGQALADLAGETSAHSPVAFTDADPALKGQSVLGIPVWGDDTAGVSAFQEGRCEGVLVGVGNTGMAARRRIFELVQAHAMPSPVLVHSRAVVARSAAVGAGTVIFGGAVLAARVHVGRNVVLYSGAVVEHDSRLADHAYLGPGVVLAGGVTVGEGAFLGAGAVVLPGLEIGAGAVVAAGAVVTEAVAPGATVAGVPARAHIRI